MGKAYDSKVDIWSIGVVTYYLLSGSHPFGADIDTVVEKIKFDELKFEDKVWNGISSKGMMRLKFKLLISLHSYLKKILQRDHQP